MIVQVTCVMIDSKKLSNVSGVDHKVMRANLKGLLLANAVNFEQWKE